MTPEERLELIRSLGEKNRGTESPAQKITQLLRLKQKIQEAWNIEVKTLGDVADAAILTAIPVPKETIVETAKEELDGFREEQRDKQTASEAITADEKTS